jgi:hypothetical protein
MTSNPYTARICSSKMSLNCHFSPKRNPSKNLRVLVDQIGIISIEEPSITAAVSKMAKEFAGIYDFHIEI